MIRISLPHNKCRCNAQCQQFRNGNGIPDSVDAKDQRQNQNGCHLEYQCSQARD